MKNSNLIEINRFKTAISHHMQEVGIYWYEEEAFAYINALLNMQNIDEIANLLSPADFLDNDLNVRKLLYNCHAYIDSLQFGFTLNDLKFCDSGWLDLPNSAWQKKQIFFNNSNYIDIWEGKNQTFTYGLHYSYGASTGGGLPSQYTSPFKCYEDARSAAIDDFENKLKHAFFNSETDTYGNYKLEILKSLEKAIKIEKSPKQLSLF